MELSTKVCLAFAIRSIEMETSGNPDTAEIFYERVMRELALPDRRYLKERAAYALHTLKVPLEERVEIVESLFKE